MYSSYRELSRKCNEWRKVKEVGEKTYGCNKDREWETERRAWMKVVGIMELIILKKLWYEDGVSKKKKENWLGDMKIYWNYVKK